jgi:hypothetical protein
VQSDLARERSCQHWGDCISRSAAGRAGAGVPGSTDGARESDRVPPPGTTWITPWLPLRPPPPHEPRPVLTHESDLGPAATASARWDRCRPGRSLLSVAPPACLGAPTTARWLPRAWPTNSAGTRAGRMRRAARSALLPASRRPAEIITTRKADCVRASGRAARGRRKSRREKPYLAATAPHLSRERDQHMPTR